VSLEQMRDAQIEVRGRHDPSIVPRALPVVEAAAALALGELWKERLSCRT
ncbi:MAG: chorismate synthase, partial [Clostridia bacterium]